jgi:hypothetical protein
MTNDAKQTNRSRRIVLVAWILTMAASFLLLWIARGQIIATYSQPQAQADWQRWQAEEAARQADPSSPVRRRPPRSAEPPPLVLMRDSFPAVAATLLVVVSVCFAFAVLSLGGLVKGRI